ncbi:MAG TPA: nucleotidyltransferase family protein [Bacteroidales bacterium]|nr:nucleotidyltransferase family protein [Bacteroidales bacterium]
MEAIILAGGLGTRLRNTVAGLPKPMAPVNGKPFLFHILNWLKEYPLDKIVISTGYVSELIIEYFGNRFNGIPIEYTIEQIPLGTGGAIRFAMQKCKGDNFLVLNGDTYYPVELDKFITFHTERKSMFSLVLKPMRAFSRYGSVECKGDTIERFVEKKQCDDGLINGGLYLINRSFFESQNLKEVFSVEKDVLEKNAGSGVIRCMVSDKPFIDIGIPEDYERAGDFMKSILKH